MATVVYPKTIKIEGIRTNHKSWILEYERYPYTPEMVEEVSQKIRANLTNKICPPKYRERNKDNSLFGHCYHATQAMFYFMDTDKLVAMSGKDELGEIHWWLQDGEKIIDVTGAQYDIIPVDAPYKVGKKTKWYGWGGRPHKKSLVLMQTIQNTALLTLENVL